MSTRTLGLADDILEYLRDVSLREPPLLARLREETARLPMGRMQISPEQGQFMAFLLRLTGARRCLEIGTFTGYSALVCALALPSDGRIVTLDTSEEWTAVARRYWREAGVEERIELRLGAASETLRAMRREPMPGDACFDFAFVDADKTGYAEYYERCLELLRPGGVIAFDNVLWGGRVARGDADEDTAALRALNARLHADERVDLSMVPIGDGLTLVRKRD